ncbi:hypothetical protein [Streptosporangium sp. NPDC001681]|uniref:hypothetical protein n=1 Tax=Streptosporangium sp. NPDC001681 TaxID=3154395 RepID=UPI00331D04C0
MAKWDASNFPVYRTGGPKMPSFVQSALFWIFLAITGILVFMISITVPKLPIWAVFIGIGIVAILLMLIARKYRGQQHTRQSEHDASSQPDGGAEGSGAPSVPFLVTCVLGITSFIAGNIGQPLIQPYIPFLNPIMDSMVGIEPLRISTQSWPADSGCDFATSVAMPAGGPRAERIPYTFQEDPRESVIKKGGVSWERGVLTVTLNSHRTVHIQSINPVITSRLEKPGFDWVLTRTRGCGPGTGKFLRLDLATSRLFEVKDGKEYPEGSSEGGPGVRGATVTPSAPLQLRLEVTSCAARTYSWFLKVRYVSEGRPDELEIGSEQNPFRSTGGVAGIPIFNISSGELGNEYKPIDTNKRTSKKCGDGS